MNEETVIKLALDVGLLNYIDNETPRHYFIDGNAGLEEVLEFAKRLDIPEEIEIEEQVPCKTHPAAPHGFDRNMSHTLDRYVCRCEHWEPEDEDHSN
jgi:hypothetical protein